MPKRNSTKKDLIYFSLFIYLFLNIYCQNCGTDYCEISGFECINKDDDHTCDQKCKPKHGSTSCYLCDFEGYYHIEEGVCQPGCNGDYIIDSTKECTSETTRPTIYKMGDVYYRTCPVYSKIKSANECECENKYYIDLVNGREIYHCLSPVSDCPDGKRYHNSGDQNKCLEGCSGSNSYSANNICYEESDCNYIKVISETDKRCLTTCDVGEGFIDTDQSNKCLIFCPDTKAYYNHGGNNCMAACSTSNSQIYRKQDGKECFSSCKDIDSGELIYTKKDASSDDYICYPSLSDEDCKYYFPLNNGVKKCVDDTETICQDSNHIYLKGKECIEECDYYKAIDDDISPFKKCFLDLNDCFNGGYEYFNLKEKICWKVIPSYYCIKKNENNIDGTFEVMPITEKFYIDTADHNNKYCCANCPTEYPFRNINSNECIANCIGSDNEYHIDGDNICYHSCKDIPSGPNGKYLYEIQRPLDGTPTEKICSDIIPYDCTFYYLDDGLKKCTTECPTSTTSPYIFHRGKECLKECDEYKAIDNRHNEVTIDSLKECFTDLNECFSGNIEYNYYNTNSKTCWSHLPTDYYIKSRSDGKYEVTANCGSNLLKYEVSGSPKKCITLEECKNLGNVKTEDLLCKTLSAVATDTDCPFIDNLECVASCGIETGYNYHNFESKECIPYCSGEYPYHKENDYVCYRSCKDIESGENKYLKGNICSRTACSSYYQKIEVDSDENFVYKCFERQEDCILAGLKYLKEDIECISECGTEEFKVKPITNSNQAIISLGACFENSEKCEDKGYHFFNSQIKECWYSGCKIGFYPFQIDINTGFPKENEDGSNCVTSCPEGYTLKDNYCIKICDNFFDEDSERCEENCYKYYYEGENICRSSPCTLFKSEDEDDNICVTQCQGNQKIEKLDGNNRCVNDCGDKYFVEEKIEIRGVQRAIKTCIDITCQEYSNEYGFIYFSENGKECLKTCNEAYYRIENFCYNKCEGSNKYLNPLDSKCYAASSACTGNHYEELLNYPGIYICKSSCEPGKFLLQEADDIERYECLSECPLGKNYIKNNKCVSAECSSEEIKIIKEVKDLYTIYECLPSCPNNGYYSSENNKCYSICKGNDIHNSFSLTQSPSGKKICSDSCSEPYKYYKDDKVCMQQCNLLIEEDTNRCIEECDNEYYKFKYEEEIEGEFRRECKLACPLTKSYYLKSDYVCRSECPEPNMYLPEVGNECISECGEHQFKEEVTGQEGLYRCVRDYGEKYYYKSNRILIGNCGTNYAVEDTHECIENCDLLTNNKYYYYEPDTDTEDTTDIKKCVLSCATTGKQFYEDNHCKLACENKEYYKPNEKICLEYCPPGFFTNGYICVNPCKTQNPNKYLDNGKCVDHCPNGDNRYKFYTEQEYECIPDCNSSNIFYTEYEITGTENKEYKCHPTCNNYYILNKEISSYAKQCLPEGVTCPSEELYSDENDENECYKNCPPDKYINENPKQCLSQCPKYKYHEKDSKLCIEPFDCQSQTADFESQECVPQCETEYFTVIEDEEADKTAKICLKDCNDDNYGHYLTPNNKCVKDCEGEVEDGFTAHSTDNKCVCPKLYYFYFNEENERQLIKCLDYDNCYDELNDSGYNIKLSGTAQCLNRCDYIKSLNGELCYKTEEEACKDELDLNSVIKIVGTGKKCECPYKFYKDEFNKKHCLNEFSDCPSTYDHYIPETKECVRNCENGIFIKNFKKICLRICPPGSVESDNICQCDNFWYATSDITFKCLNENDLCPDTYPVYVPDTKECLISCKGSNYPYLYDSNQCLSGCIYNTQPISINNDLADLACICKKPWYFYFDNSEKKMECAAEDDDTINYCYDYGRNINFMIHETKECVEECPGDYPYYFNNECFNNCEIHAKRKYPYLVQKESYECQCKYLWHYKDYSRKIKECFELNQQSCIENIPQKPYLVIDTNECLEECSPEMKAFNMTCYNKCPEYTIDRQDENQQEYTCSCNKELDLYWYQIEKNYIIPAAEDPEIDEPEEAEPTKFIYYVCGVQECPVERPNLLREEKQCLLSCNIEEEGYKFKYNLRNICVEKCPDYTDFNNEELICTFINLENEELVTDKESLKNYANVQAKELYESRLTINDGNRLGGFLFNKFDEVSLQIYAIDKGNTLKKYSTKSNLTYIDFDTCLPKIFEDNSMKDTDKILVTKYDLSYWNAAETSSGDDENEAGDETPPTKNQNKDDEKHLINKVEYELYNSRTMERIYASICEPYEILISYPIAFNKNRYNNYASGFNDNEYKSKFEIGKNLHQINNELDTFNSNDTLYKDLCTGIEIDGKDLVLEDRFKYLYPNGAVLCESNCTFNKTDFDNERVYCKCSYKEGIDFKRQENEKNDLINDPNFHLPEQSSGNLEVIKCLKRFSFEKFLKNNEAFYYCAAITTVVISMTLVTGLYGFKAISSNITNILNKFGHKKGNQINNLEIEPPTSRKKFNNNDNEINTSNRMINNPPKKNNNSSEEENEDNRNIICNKDIGNNNNKTITQTSKNDDDELIENIDNGIYLDNNSKAEYLPPQYNFKYFKSNDKGVRKQIERTKLPFKVNPYTKYLIESKKGVTYPENYLKGPFYSNQNIIEIIDEYNVTNYKNINNSKEVKYIRNNNYENEIEISSKKRNINNKLNFIMNMRKENNSGSKEKKEIDFINIKKIKFSKNNNNNEDLDNEDDISEREVESLSLFTLIKREQTLLRVSYNKYISKDHSNILSIFLAEILDKVYFVKTCLFLKKYEIFGVHLSLYLFCHIFLFILSCAFFTISTIKKIWSQDKYPGMQYYLLYGIITNIVVWVVYKIFLCLLDIQDNIKELIKENNKNKSDNFDENNNNKTIENKYNEVLSKLKCRIIIFYFVIFVFIIIFSLYLISFFAVYTGTKSYVLEAYIISIIEILLVKFVYGICLAALRVASKGSEFKGLYKLVYILDKYLS